MSVSLKSDELSYRQPRSKYKFWMDSPEEEDSPKIRFLYHKVLKHMKLSDRNGPAKPEALSPSTEAKWAVLLNLVIQNGALLMNTTDMKTAETYCIERADQVMALLNKQENSTVELSASEGRFLASLFTPDPTFIQSEKETISWMWQKLFRMIPGKTDEEKENYIKNHRDDLPKMLQDLLHQTEDYEADFQKNQADFTRQCDIAAAALLSQTDLFDRCLDQNCIPAMEVLAKLFNRHPVLLQSFITKINPYLKNKNPDKDDPYGYQYVVHNMAFAGVIRDKVSPYKWDAAVLVSLLANALHDKASPAVMADFVDKTNRLPEKSRDLLAQIVSDLIRDICIPEKIAGKKVDFLPDLRLNNLFTLLSRTTSQKMKSNLCELFEGLPPDKVRAVWQTAETDQDRAAFFRLLNESEKGRALIPVLDDIRKANSVWDLADKGIIGSAEMKPVIDSAIRNGQTAFLLAPKNQVLSPDFPAYDKLKAYFKHHPKGLSFIAGFRHPHMTPDIRFHLALDFVPNRPLALAQLYGIVSYWARMHAEEKILSFLFEGDLERQQNIRPRFTQKDLNRLMLMADESGKTPWHYACARKSRLLFGRHFKALYPSFLQALQYRDKNGVRPLDLIRNDLKFRQVIVEKIPAAEKIMIENGLSLVYVPPIREKEESPAPTPVAPKPIQKPQAVHSDWIVRKIGNDKNRKDDSYQTEIQSKIDLLPSPEEIGRVSLSKETLKKKFFEASTFKIHHNNKYWHVPFVHNAETKTIYILPGSDRDDTYSNQDYIRLVRNLVKRIKRQERFNARQHD